jgi:hypothetical protein
VLELCTDFDFALEAPDSLRIFDALEDVFAVVCEVPTLYNEGMCLTPSPRSRTHLQRGPKSGISGIYMGRQPRSYKRQMTNLRVGSSILPLPTILFGIFGASHDQLVIAPREPGGYAVKELIRLPL